MAKSMIGIDPDGVKLRRGEFWALRDVSFELKKGECLGIIGENGSGKSTLLRLINGIFPPTVGRIITRGRIGALIAVGAGFHPQMTGRENIFLNGSILGMDKQEIKGKFDEIVDFADLGDFIDSPVSTYSSGMYIRLGFSIAIHSSPEIILADEVLAVGDLSFALKSYRKISQFRQSGGTILLVSHNLQLIRNSCQEAIWLENGTVRDEGNVNEVCDEYEKNVMRKDDSETKGDQDALGSRVNTDHLAQITNVELIDVMGEISSEFTMGFPFRARIHFRCERIVVNPIFTFAILTPERLVVVSNYSSFDGTLPENIEGKGYIDFVIEKLSLKQGTYFISVSLKDNNDLSSQLDWHEQRYSFKVVRGGPVSYGLINPWPSWSLNRQSEIDKRG
jgi:ABC-type polysaccharide/polyol phosphate transport system ATPase subunit